MVENTRNLNWRIIYFSIENDYREHSILKFWINELEEKRKKSPFAAELSEADLENKIKCLKIKKVNEVYQSLGPYYEYIPLDAPPDLRQQIESIDEQIATARQTQKTEPLDIEKLKSAAQRIEEIVSSLKYDYDQQRDGAYHIPYEVASEQKCRKV